MSSICQYAKLVRKLTRIKFSNEINKDVEYRKAIFYELKAWGGVYIKFLQIMAGNSRFMDGWGGPKEMEVFSQAPREDLNVLDYIKTESFSEVSAEPFAAGSFALVYHGRLNNGKEVAIKILRPSIKKNLKHDLSTLKYLCRLFANLFPKTIVDYNEAYAECAKMFLEETDYEREIANQNFFAKLYKNHPSVVIPKVYQELSSHEAIVQEFIPGPTLAEMMSSAKPEHSASQLTRQITGSDLWKQIIIAGGEALYMAMCADYVYGDPHPGNIILLPNNKIAFVDFGIIARKPTSHFAFYEWMDSYYKILTGDDNFKQLVRTSAICFCPEIASAMQGCSIGKNDLLTTLAEAVDNKLNIKINDDTSYTEQFENGHFASILISAIDTQVFDIDIKTVNFELVKAMQAFLGSVTILDNSEGKHSFANIMKQSIEYALTNAKQKGIPHDNTKMPKFSLTESYELLVNTLSTLADKDEYIFNFIQERILV